MYPDFLTFISSFHMISFDSDKVGIGCGWDKLQCSRFLINNIDFFHTSLYCICFCILQCSKTSQTPIFRISVSVNPWKDSVSESSSAAQPLKLLTADHIFVSVNPWKDSESVSSKLGSRDSPDTVIWLLLISFNLVMAHWMMCCFSLAVMTLMARFTSLLNLTLCSLGMWSQNLVLILFL